jgi:hypothetical protein
MRIVVMKKKLPLSIVTFNTPEMISKITNELLGEFQKIRGFKKLEILGIYAGVASFNLRKKPDIKIHVVWTGNPKIVAYTPHLETAISAAKKGQKIVDTLPHLKDSKKIQGYFKKAAVQMGKHRDDIKAFEKALKKVFPPKKFPRIWSKVE